MQVAHELNLPSTKDTPEVVLNPDGIIKISGRSMNVNVSEFSRTILEWIDSYICNPAEITCVDICLEYLNTSNYRFYITLLRKIETIKLKNKKFFINWYYEVGDEDIIEKGEYLSSILEIPFNFIMISETNEQELINLSLDLNQSARELPQMDY